MRQTQCFPDRTRQTDDGHTTHAEKMSSLPSPGTQRKLKHIAEQCHKHITRNVLSQKPMSFGPGLYMTLMPTSLETTDHHRENPGTCQEGIWRLPDKHGRKHYYPPNWIWNLPEFLSGFVQKHHRFRAVFGPQQTPRWSEEHPQIHKWFSLLIFTGGVLNSTRIKRVRTSQLSSTISQK